MKVFKVITAILCIFGLGMIFLTVSTSDYEDETRMAQEERMSSSEVITRSSLGLITLAAGVTGYNIACKIEDQREYEFERRKCKYRYK